MSKKRRLARALAGAAALYGASKLMGMGGAKTPTGAPPGAKTPSSSKKIGKTIVRDTGSKTMVGTPVKTTVDRDALPKEIKEKVQKVAKSNEKIKKAVIKRRDEGMLSPTMPKRANQISSDFGLGIMGGAKKGKMVKARGGGMAMGGMKPTKLY
tara:strand:- start:320 stop:781 length:462 start_codon:yes stop_codon:yes gene_type:complete